MAGNRKMWREIKKIWREIKKIWHTTDVYERSNIRGRGEWMDGERDGETKTRSGVHLFYSTILFLSLLMEALLTNLFFIEESMASTIYNRDIQNITSPTT